jgi:hypothetical protein
VADGNEVSLQRIEVDAGEGASSHWRLNGSKSSNNQR